MSDQHLRAITERLQRVVAADRWEDHGPCTQLDTGRYLDPRRWSDERDTVFRRFPLIVARAGELDAQRPWLGLDLAGRGLLLSRGPDGRIRAFLNACRHRGMQLLAPGAHACKSALSCPYHGWTYGPEGALRGLPHAEAFPGLEREAHALVELPCAVRHGFVWVRPEPDPAPLDIGGWLGTLDDDFQYFGLDRHVLYTEARRRVAANWKLCIDAFLEAYHVKVLHRTTVGPFFEDALACQDDSGPHVRSAVARKPLRAGQLEPLREAVSFTHFVFPNQIFIFHPDYASQLSILPVSERAFDWRHRMLIPAEMDSPEHREHWEKSYALIEEGVFASEDLRAAEEIQCGLDSGANRKITLGQMEQLIARFHARLDRAAAGADIE